MINWTDPKCSISKYFTVKDACLLPSWGVLHMPSDVEKANILRTAAVMDEIRAFLGAPILVHCWIRPGSVNCPGNPHHGQDYNAFIKGAPKSAHKSGLAVDWHALKESCDTSRARLLPELERLKIRMEDLPKSGWVHIDLNPPNPIRFFKP